MTDNKNIDIRETLTAVFAAEDSIKALETDVQTALEALHETGSRGPWQTSRGTLSLKKRSAGKRGGVQYRLVSVELAETLDV